MTMRDDFYTEDEAPSCPMCGGNPVMLGALGNRAHFRCRSCGMDYSIEAGEIETETYCAQPRGKR